MPSTGSARTTGPTYPKPATCWQLRPSPENSTSQVLTLENLVDPDCFGHVTNLCQLHLILGRLLFFLPAPLLFVPYLHHNMNTRMPGAQPSPKLTTSHATVLLPNAHTPLALSLEMAPVSSGAPSVLGRSFLRDSILRLPQSEL